MDVKELDKPLIKLSGGNFDANYWTIRNAVEGVQIFGGIGSGKTTGSGKMIAEKYLEAGFGGLVLTVKPDEKELWESYCQKTGRSHDLVIVEPGSGKYFNFLQYESKGEGMTENVVQVLKTVIRASEEKSSGKADDPFWESALDMLLFHVIDLCKLAYGRVSVEKMFNIVQHLPKPGTKYEEVPQQDGFYDAFVAAKENVKKQTDAWEEGLTTDQMQEIIINNNLDEVMCAAIADASLLNYLDQFFLDTYRNLSEKTRSIIDFSFSGFLFRLLREPVYSLFCKNASTFTPEDCYRGKIILLNLPVKTYHKVGRDIQILFKYIWQRAMEKRKITADSPPVFLWADEAQNFLHEYDADYQATARSSQIATVYISQNLPNYHASMGGAKSEFKVKSFLGTLATKIFHANADFETNKYASDLIGDAGFEDPSRSSTVSGKFSSTQTFSLRIDRAVRPEAFVQLKTGGPLNSGKVEAYLHMQGNPIKNKLNYTKILFNQ
jgi:type IV secretory pathway TraG/TraD family ATPase VirD4